MSRYKKSEQLLTRALKTIPLGSQTFSKSSTQLPKGVSPYFVERGDGCRVWDVDGNEYFDFVNALLAVSLGYRDPDVDRAVREQLERGVSFSLSHRLEVEVAETIVELVPCAQKVRFGKNGSDATTGAIRIARAFTGRDRVAVCGYHGWHDWYIGSTTRNLGVPGVTQELTDAFIYNDIASLENIFARHSNALAAVILEPMNVIEPKDGFLEAVQAMCASHGALLIFDETITGFRLSLGGAQELFGVTPDLATFGKGLANGHPLSVLTGRRDVMDLASEVFFSSTFGGETLSLAAARAVLAKLRREPVLETIHRQGQLVMAGLNDLIATHDLADIAAVSGHPAWSFLNLRDTSSYTSWEIKTLVLQELFARGILTIGSHNMSYAHGHDAVDALLSAYDEVLGLLRRALADGDVRERLHCEPLKALFTVR